MAAAQETQCDVWASLAATPPDSGPPMPSYRLYFTGPDGHFVDVLAFCCPDDATAHALACGHLGARGMELWSGARVVRTYAPQPPHA